MDWVVGPINLAAVRAFVPLAFRTFTIVAFPFAPFSVIVAALTVAALIAVQVDAKTRAPFKAGRTLTSTTRPAPTVVIKFTELLVVIAGRSYALLSVPDMSCGALATVELRHPTSTEP